ncbi:PTS-dependent dihydroxyacetone kinase phosphotransferase subunit DhaM [Tessaracoccus palaemonis]|uniref:Phosphocarrier protein HPr n=1 Tax=Tessaracoccus palaemonis TaxID=2829499 RepID=A0ABX8SHB5_9ACTN|nr:dihydroxyacetone kinase phosphoryl donor subunit DhaM [Tessaracoccus palaemonis]QXT62349.1 PTS-dependent dihydroxyacetone kinase phosphotransferase subunit DhaM [Tessaracoccus palaemonis]
MAVGIVVVSHSHALAEAAVELAMQMVHGDAPPIALAAGTSDGGLGTDATAVTSALADVDQGDGVVVLVDMGSALMSAELGVELYDQPGTDVRILPAPFVEGLVAAVVRATGGASIDEVAAEADQGLTPKLSALGTPPVPAPQVSPVEEASEDDTAHSEAVIVNTTGLHARPAAELVAQARSFDAEVKVSCGDAGPVSAKSSIGLATLAARKGDLLEFTATGAEAEQAVEALAQFVSNGLGEL